MRHKKSFNHLSRKAPHRKAMLSNMASQLIMHKRINTTLAKAKALRSFVEPLITKSKEDSTHSRRMVFRYLQNKEAINELFREVSQKIADRPGGYTRILKTGFRKGDGAEMCFIELVDYNENMLATAEEETQKRTRRSRRGGKKKASSPAETAAANTQVQKPETLEEDKEVKAGQEAKTSKTDEATKDQQADVVSDTEKDKPAEAKSDKKEKKSEAVKEKAADPEAKPEAKKDKEKKAEAEQKPEDKKEVKDAPKSEDNKTENKTEDKAEPKKEEKKPEGDNTTKGE